MLTPEQKQLARHALGLVDGNKRSYRNRYRAPKDGAVVEAWRAMHAAGYAKCSVVADDTPLGDYFWMTEAGARLALEKGETLDPEDFQSSNN